MAYIKIKLQVKNYRSDSNFLVPKTEVLDAKRIDLESLYLDAREMISEYTKDKYELQDDEVVGLITEYSYRTGEYHLIGIKMNGVPDIYTKGMKPYERPEEGDAAETASLKSEDDTEYTEAEIRRYIAEKDRKTKFEKRFNENKQLEIIIHTKDEGDLVFNSVKINKQAKDLIQKDAQQVLLEVKEEVEKKKKELQQKLNSKVKHQRTRTLKGGISVTRKKPPVIKDVLSSISNTQVTPVTNQFIRKLNDIFSPNKVVENLQFKPMQSADLIVPGKRYKMPNSVLKAIKTKEYRKLAKQEKKKLRFLLYYGCYVAATYFQMLVSNTPMDEKYSFKKKVVSNDRAKLYDTRYGARELKIRNKKNIVKDMNVGIREVTEYHTPDKHSVRGDWVLTFRGKNFKAFQTEPEKYSISMPIDYTFNASDFENKVDPDAIERIALQLYELTKDSGDYSATFQKQNLNPRWEVLEKGGYMHESTPKVGAKYTHGVTNTHLTYQAPYGFVAITDAVWDVLVNSGKWPGTVTNFVNHKMNKLDVSKLDSTLMKKVFELHPELRNVGKSFDGVYRV